MPAEHGGPVLTVYLPGSAARADLGWDPGTDLLVSFDPDRGTLRICSASALEDEVSDALTRLQQSPPPPAATDPSAWDTDRRVIALRQPG